MKKSIYALLPLLFSFLCISAQSYKIAVLPFKSSSNQGLNQSIPDRIMTNLGNSKKFTIVERAQIDYAMQHFQTEQSELINDATAVEIGQWIGANAIIIGNYVQENGQVRIEARVVDVNSGTPINSAKVQGLSNEIFKLVDNLSEEILAPLTGVNLSSVENKDYYFQPGNQLLAEIYRYEVKGVPSTRLVGKLNTGENLYLSKLLNPDNTDAINLETDKTYQITFSGNLGFQAIEFGAPYPDGLVDFGYPVNYNFEFYGTDTFTLSSNETNIIQVDIAGPPRILFTNRKTSNMGRFTKMKWKLQVTNK